MDSTRDAFQAAVALSKADVVAASRGRGRPVRAAPLADKPTFEVFHSTPVKDTDMACVTRPHGIFTAAGCASIAARSVWGRTTGSEGGDNTALLRVGDDGREEKEREEREKGRKGDTDRAPLRWCRCSDGINTEREGERERERGRREKNVHVLPTHILFLSSSSLPLPLSLSL